MSEVLDRSQATLGARLVILVLADFADDEHRQAWPSIRRLSELTLLSERQVQYALRKLEESGEIKRVGKSRYGTFVYQVELVEGGADIAPLGAARGATHCTGGVQPTAPEPSLDPPLVREANASLTQRSGRTNGKERPRDALWDVLEAEIGAVSNELERGRRNKALKALRESEATPEQVTRAVVEYRKRWPGVDLTALALASNWSALTAGPQAESREDEMRRLEARAIDRGVL